MGRWVGGGVAVLAAFGAAAGPQTAIADTTSSVTASAVAVEVLEPGRAAIVAGDASTATQVKDGDARLKMPRHRSAIKAGRWVTVVGGVQALARVNGGSLFGGEITFGQASAFAQIGTDTASTAGTSQVTHLKLFGRPVHLHPGVSVALGKWGALTLGEHPAASSAGATSDAQAAITIDFTASHAGLPAGTR